MSGAEIAGVVVGSITAIGVFVGPLLANRLRARNEELNRKLRIHFEDLSGKVIEPMLTVVTRVGRYEDGELVFERASYTSFENFKFEEGDFFRCFELHFPEKVVEWGHLKHKAVEHNKLYREFEVQRTAVGLIEEVEEAKDVRSIELGSDLESAHAACEESGKRLSDHAESLVEDFKRFGAKLAADSSYIRKYEIGKTFKKLKNCPICQKL
ncbi:MAG: hypothetical protein IMY87_07725 [Chloroflexi bacterium]|nr:hypothetical protein [Chloroflexota bacterium]